MRVSRRRCAHSSLASAVPATSLRSILLTASLACDSSHAPQVRALASSDHGPILLDPKALNYGLREAAGDDAVLHASPISVPKACKNEAELSGMREAHLTDGASLAKFFAWLQKTVVDEQTPITEVCCRPLGSLWAHRVS